MAIDELTCGMTGQAALDQLNEVIVFVNSLGPGGVTDIQNAGGGNEVLRDLIAGIATLRSLIGTGATTVSTVGDTIRINTPSGIISSINEDFGAIVLHSGVTAQALTTTPVKLANWTINGPDIQNTSPDFTTGDLEVLNSGLWTFSFNGIGNISSNNLDVVFEIYVNDAEIAIQVVTLVDFGLISARKAFNVDITGHFSSGDTISIYAYTVSGATNVTMESAYLSAQRGAESELSQDTLDQILANSYTGWLTVPTIVANANPALFDLGPGLGVIIDRTDPANTVSNIIVFPGFTGIALAHVGTRIVNIGVTGPLLGDVIQSIAAFERETKETTLVIGNLTQGPQPTNNTVELATRVPSNNYNLDMAFRSLLDALGGINLKGLTYSGVPGTLQLQHSPGVGLTLGRNYDADPGFPDWPPAAAQVSPILREKYRDVGGVDLTTRAPAVIDLDVDRYTDNNGNLIAMPNNNWQIKRVYFFYNSNQTIVYYGSVPYPNETAARNAVFSEEFTEHPDTFEAVFRAWIIVQEGETNSNNYIFITGGLLRSSGAGTGGQITTSMQDSYEITSVGTPHVTTNGVNGPVTFRDDTGLLNPIFKLENNVPSTVFTVNILGDIECSDILAFNGNYTFLTIMGTGSNSNSTFISNTILGIPTWTINGFGDADGNSLTLVGQLDADTVIGDISGATLGFNQVQDNGTPVTARTKTNFINFTLVDNAGNDSTDITAPTGGGGGITEYAEFSRSAQLVIGNGVTVTAIGNVAIAGVPQTGTSYNSTTGETTVPAGKDGVWDIGLMAEFNANGTNPRPYLEYRLLINGSTTRTSNRTSYQDVGLNGIHFKPSLYLSAADVVEITIQNQMGVTNAIEQDGYQQISLYRGLPA